MKAVIYESYGPPTVLQMKDIPQPIPRPHEVRIKIHATTVTNGDTRMRSFTVPRGQWLAARLYLGMWKPKRKILGMEVAGIIDAVGAYVTQFQLGDQVIASTFAVGFGGYAEFVCIPEDGVIIKKPSRLNWMEAAAVPGAGMTALRCLRRGHIRQGDHVLIYGASGAVGTNAVQLAKMFGATVTGVCSTANTGLIAALGADHVLDYTKDDLARTNQRYDVLIDAVGKLSHPSIDKLLKRTGIALNVHTASRGRETRDDLALLKTYIDQEHLEVVLDRWYSLDQIVAAHEYVDLGHKKGHVAIVVADTDVK